MVVSVVCGCSEVLFVVSVGCCLWLQCSVVCGCSAVLFVVSVGCCLWLQRSVVCGCSGVFFVVAVQCCLWLQCSVVCGCSAVLFVVAMEYMKGLVGWPHNEQEHLLMMVGEAMATQSTSKNMAMFEFSLMRSLLARHNNLHVCDPHHHPLTPKQQRLLTRCRPGRCSCFRPT